MEKVLWKVMTAMPYITNADLFKVEINRVESIGYIANISSIIKSEILSISPINDDIGEGFDILYNVSNVKSQNDVILRFYIEHKFQFFIIEGKNKKTLVFLKNIKDMDNIALEI